MPDMIASRSQAEFRNPKNVRREIWGRRLIKATKKPTYTKGTSYFVARDNSGHVISRVKYSRKTPITSLRHIFSQTGTLHKDLFRYEGSKVVEYTQWQKGEYKISEEGREKIRRASLAPIKKLPQRRHASIVQYIVKVWLKDGHQITARSPKYSDDRVMGNDVKAREQAWIAIFELLASYVNNEMEGHYDADEGSRLFNNWVIKVMEGKVSYVGKYARI